MPDTTDLPPRPQPDLGVILREERAQALAQVADLAAELDGIMAAAEAAPPDDEHDAEGSTVGYERARVRALLDHARDRLAGLDDALGRLEAGEYGRCEGLWPAHPARPPGGPARGPDLHGLRLPPLTPATAFARSSNRNVTEVDLHRDLLRTVSRPVGGAHLSPKSAIEARARNSL